jgi:hypothetical protein
MDQLVNNQQALFFLRQIQTHLPEVKHQLSLLNTSAMYVQSKKLEGEAIDIEILPQDLKPQTIHLLYGLLHSLKV